MPSCGVFQDENGKWQYREANGELPLGLKATMPLEQIYEHQKTLPDSSALFCMGIDMEHIYHLTMRVLEQLSKKVDDKMPNDICLNRLKSNISDFRSLCRTKYSVVK